MHLTSIDDFTSSLLAAEVLSDSQQCLSLPSRTPGSHEIGIFVRRSAPDGGSDEFCLHSSCDGLLGGDLSLAITSRSCCWKRVASAWKAGPNGSLGEAM